MTIRSNTTHRLYPKRLKKGRSWLLLLLLLPCILLLEPALYNLDQPELIGIPFFYWFQILCILITALLTAFLSRTTE